MKLNSLGFGTKLLCVASECVHVCVHERQVEKDNVGYDQVLVSSSLILHHQISVHPTCLTTEEESPLGDGFSDNLQHLSSGNTLSSPCDLQALDCFLLKESENVWLWIVLGITGIYQGQNMQTSFVCLLYNTSVKSYWPKYKLLSAAAGSLHGA